MTRSNPNMPRRHFELIARTFREADRTDDGSAYTAYTADKLHREFASVLAGTNGLFDRDRFVRACNGRG